MACIIDASWNRIRSLLSLWVECKLTKLTPLSPFLLWIWWFKLTITSHGSADPVSTCADAAVALHLRLSSILIGLIFQSTLCNNTKQVTTMIFKMRLQKIQSWLPTLYYTKLKSAKAVWTSPFERIALQGCICNQITVCLCPRFPNTKQEMTVEWLYAVATILEKLE